MKLWHCLSKENQGKLAQAYKELTGKEFIPPGKAVHIESLEEIDKLMREVPNPTERK